MYHWKTKVSKEKNELKMKVKQERWGKPELKNAVNKKKHTKNPQKNKTKSLKKERVIIKKEELHQQERKTIGKKRE